jgi:hypothetical protein
MRGLFKTWLAIVAVSLSPAAPVAAGPFEDGRVAFELGDYATAAQLWRPLADQGHVISQTNLGYIYSSGKGVPQDYAEAMKWFRKAADQGHAYAQFSVGRMYEEGKGVRQDYAEAVKWYRKGADQGQRLGAAAQNALGLMYSTGGGVRQDYVQAHMWFNLSATTGYPDAVKNRDAMASKMTTAQITEAQKLAREWKPK